MCRRVRRWHRSSRSSFPRSTLVRSLAKISSGAWFRSRKPGRKARFRKESGLVRASGLTERQNEHRSCGARCRAADLLSLLLNGLRHTGLVRLIFQVVHFLLGVVQRLLLVGDLLLELGVLFVPVGGIAKTIAGVGIHGGGAQLVFALRHVEFSR